MADEDVIVGEVEADPIETNNPIEDFLDAVQDQNFTQAKTFFDDVLNDRLQDAIDQKKVAVSQSVYGTQDDIETSEDES